jgi:CubicO group peptidase (beta-lactamase class C family)
MTTARARPPTDAGPADTRDGGAVARRPHRIGLLAATALLAGVVGWLAGPQPARLGAATTGDPALAAAVRAAVDDPTGYRGLAVALVEDGTVRYAGLGETAPGGRPVDQDTAFEIGSIGKPLTAMLLVELAEDGTVPLDRPLRDLLPDVPLSHELARVTPDELASHRSGLPGVHYRTVTDLPATLLRDLSARDPYAGQDTAWLRTSLAGAPARTAGEPAVGYSNYGFAVLGHALATRTGTPYPRLLADRILRPLGMTRTGLHLDGAALPAGHAEPGTASGRTVAPWQSSGYAPAGAGLWSTARDLSRLVVAMLDGTAPGAGAARPRYAEREDRWVGYGWFTSRVAGRTVVWHNGGTGGFRSYVGYEPATGRGVVVLGNTDRDVDALALRLLTGSGADEPALPDLPVIVMTVVLSLTGGSLLLVAGRNRPTDRLRLASGAVWAVAGPALAYPLGGWHTVPPLVWAAGVAVSAAAVPVAARRWAAVPVVAGSRPRLRWLGTGLSLALATAALAWVLPPALGAGG